MKIFNPLVSVCLSCCLLTLGLRAATVTWDGGGGNFSWQTAANWSGNALPGANDDAIINIVGTATVTSSANVTIRSLQCSNHLALAGGTFRVGGGSSVVQGEFSASGFPMLSATGALTEFKVAGPVNADSASFEALSGADILLPQMRTYSRGFGCLAGVWMADGPGSTLNFSGLTNFFGGTCAGVDVNAWAGGKVLLPSLTAISDGVVTIRADGVNSLIDLPVLVETLGTFRPVTLEARNGGTVNAPALRRGTTLAITLNPDATMPAGQLEQLVSITVNGGNVSFPALTNFNDGTFIVNSGAVVSAPNLVAYVQGTSCAADFWTVTGAGSLLNLPALTNLTGGTCGGLRIETFSGGTVLLTNVQSVGDGTLSCLADGTNSLVDLARLQQIASPFRAITFEARMGGTIWIPLVTGGPTVGVELDATGTLPITQLTVLGDITVAGRAFSFPALTNFPAGNFTLTDGAVVSAPLLMSYDKGASCFQSAWLVSGSGTLLNLPALTNVTGGSCAALLVEAGDGGTVLLTNVTSLSDGILIFRAKDSDSAIDLRSLAQSPGTLRAVSFEIRGGGDVLFPQFPGGSTVGVTLSGNGSMAVAQLRVLNSVTVGGRTESFPALTNFNVGAFLVTNGAVVSAPNLTTYDRGTFCGVASWIVSGAGSRLDLPGLVGLTGGGCVPLSVEALGGGNVMLTNLPAITEGWVEFLADGAGSLIDLRAVSQSLATSRPVSFVVRNAGTIQVPLLPGGPTVEVSLASGGVLPVAQMRRLSRITVNGMNIAFPGLTNFDNGSLAVTNAATVSAPNVGSYAAGSFCGGRTWQVSGAGSAADFAGLRQLTGNGCDWLHLRAFSGGDLLLGGVTNIPSGNVAVISDGTSSLVDLSSLNNFLNPAGLSSLTETNNGVILLNNQPWVLSGVGISLPGTMMTNRNQLVLAAEPWRSYWVESRNTTSPTNPWTFYRRVPATNELQAIGRRAAANTEFRVWEFVADPYLLDLDRVGMELQLVLYAPTNRTLDVQSASNLTPVINWQTFAAVTMTNTFRIFPPEPASAPQKYFRARTQ